MNPFSQLSAIFDRAIQIECRDERNAFIDEACCNNQKLKEEVDELVHAFENCDSVLANSSMFVDRLELKKLFLKSKPFDRESDCGNTNNSSIESVGDRLGPYLLEEEVGSGGFGVVFRAVQEKPIRREVAIKLIKPGMDTREVLSRFDLERQALAVMDHSSIAKIYDAGATHSGRPYFAMEYVEGIPINQFCDEKKLTIRQRIELMIQVCQGIQHAHQKGVIHRDIKPSNILVSIAEDGAVPKLIDFGVAKALGLKVNDETIQTREGEKIGTPLYMSPEQAAGLKVADIDARTDIYSLGAVIFELITGTTPVTRDALAESSGEGIFEVIQKIDTPLPSKRIRENKNLNSKQFESRGCSFSGWVKQVQGELDWILAKTLDSDRERRYESASELANDLQRFLDGEPVEAVKPSQLYRFKKFARRNIGAFAIAAGIVLVLLASTATSIWFGIRANRNAAMASAAGDRERLEKEKAIDAEARATREKQRYAMLFDDASRLIQIVTLKATDEKKKEKLKKHLDVVIARAETENFDASYLLEFGRALCDGTEFDSAIEMLSKARQLAEQQFGPNHRDCLEIMCELSKVYLEKAYVAYPQLDKVPKKIAKELQPGFEITKELVRRERDLPDGKAQTSRALTGLCAYYRRFGDYENAISVLKEATILYPKTTELDYAEVLSTHSQLAWLHYVQGDRKKAADLTDANYHRFKACESKIAANKLNGIKQKILSDRNQLLNLAGRHREIIGTMEELAKLIEAKNDDHFSYQIVANNLGDGYRRLCRPFDALEAYQSAADSSKPYLEEAKETLAKREYVFAYSMIASEYVAVGQPETAIRVLEHIPLFAKGILEPNDIRTIRLEWNRARALTRLNQHDKALELLEKAVKVASSVWGKNHSFTLQVVGFQASILEEQGKFAEALEIRQDVARRSKIGSLDFRSDFRHPDYWRKTGVNYLKSGQHEKAIEILEKCYEAFKKSNGVHTTNASYRAWYVAEHLADAYNKVERSDDAIALLSQTLDQKLKVFGAENRSTLATRTQLGNMFLESSEQAKKQYQIVDKSYQEMATSARKKWPKGWQSFNVMNRWFVIKLDRVERFRDPKVKLSQLQQLESQILQHFNELEAASISNGGVLKRELCHHCIKTLVRLYENLEKPDDVAKWKSRLPQVGSKTRNE